MVNKVILIGNVGKDPEIRYVENNVCVANLTLATTERGYTTQSGTQIPERTEWHNLVLWRGLAEVAEKYVRKGSQIYVEGKIRTRSWEDQAGQRRYMTEIFVDNFQLLGKRSDATTGVSQPIVPSVTIEQKTTEYGLGNPSPVDDLPF